MACRGSSHAAGRERGVRQGPGARSGVPGGPAGGGNQAWQGARRSAGPGEEVSKGNGTRNRSRGWRGAAGFASRRRRKAKDCRGQDSRRPACPRKQPLPWPPGPGSLPPPCASPDIPAPCCLASFTHLFILSGIIYRTASMMLCGCPPDPCADLPRTLIPRVDASPPAPCTPHPCPLHVAASSCSGETPRLGLVPQERPERGPRDSMGPGDGTLRRPARTRQPTGSPFLVLPPRPEERRIWGDRALEQSSKWN